MNETFNIHSTYQGSLNNSDNDNNDNNDNNNQLSCLTNVSSPASSEEFVYSRSADIGSTVQSSLLTHNEKPQRLEQNISQYDPNEPLPFDDSNKCLEESSQSLSEYSPNVEEEQREKDAISSGTSILADDKINSNSDTDNNDNSQFKKYDLSSSTFQYRTSTAEEAAEKHLQNLLKDQNIRNSQSDLSSVTDDDLKSGIPQNDSKNSKYNSSSSDTALPKYQKFSYFETDDGYFVQVGENQLRDCSDEPIHIPGAIQSYGCLLVVEENDIDIIVRQASRNSKNIIGLSPKELFNLNCFTEILEQHESATKLRDVLFEFGEAEKNLEKRPIDESDVLQTFPLSGHGGVDSNGEKIMWHCWCVAHRAPEPIPINNKIPKRKDLFPNSSYILEFEPVYDISVQNKKDFIDIIPREGQEINKLYPLSMTYEGDGSSGGDTSTIKDKTESGDTVKLNDQNKNTTTDNKNKDIEAKIADDEPWSLGNDSYATLDEMRRSTISCSKPLKVLERARRSQRTFHQHQLIASQRAEEKEKDLDDDLKRINRFERERETVRAYIRRNIQNPDGIASMDYVSLLSEVDEQLQVDSLDRLFDVVTGIVKDLINFQRTMVYLFDDNNNGKVVGELVDFRKCRELFRNLYFPSTDIPAQARDLYRRNKVRQLYDRKSKTSRIVCRNKDELLYSLDMSNCFLRALSPIHLKYLEHMNAISSVSISIVAFGKLYGLVACHSFFGDKMRVSFPQRQILSMLSDIISRNVERIILLNKNTISIEHESSTSRSFESPSVDPNSMDLLQLFDCVNAFISIENTERLIGPEDNIETVKYIGNHFKNKGIRDITFTTNIRNDFPDLKLKDVNKFSGILYVPLTENNFILFIREGLLSSITWAGNPSHKQLQTGVLEPRNSFKKWTETVQGTSKKWRPEDIENSKMLSIIYGKILSLHQTNDFDEIYKDKRKVVNDLLTTSVGHELKTPLHQHLSYLEMALEGKKLDKETRRNLKKSKISVDNLLYNVNDIIDLIGNTESNNNNQQSVLNEAMDLIECIDEVIELFKNEMASKGITIQVNTVSTPRHITSDRRKIRLIISNLLENAIKFSNNNSRIYLDSSFVPEYENEGTAAVKFVIRDEGLGIRPKRLKEMFKSFETTVETDEDSDESSIDSKVTFGKGLAQVSRAVSKLNAKMTANSSVGSKKRHSGSTFTVFIPFNTPSQSEVTKLNNTTNTPSDNSSCNRRRNFLSESTSRSTSKVRKRSLDDIRKYKDEKNAQDIKVEDISLNVSPLKDNVNNDNNISRINVLAVDDDPINNKIIKKRLMTNKFKVTTANNGQVAIDKLSKNENEFDYILLDLMMPIKDGIDTVRCIRKMKLKRRQCNYDIPVLAFSASITSNDLSQLKEAGFSGFFTKPINFKHLVEMLKNYNERSKYIYETGKNFGKGGFF